MLSCRSPHAALPREPPRPRTHQLTHRHTCLLSTVWRRHSILGCHANVPRRRMCVASAGAGASPACRLGGALTHGRDNGNQGLTQLLCWWTPCCVPSRCTACCRTLAVRLLHAASSQLWLAPLVKPSPSRGSALLHKQEPRPLGHCI